MSNIKISELPEFTGNTSGSWLVMDDSTQTTTYKVLRENIVSTTSGTSGTSGYNGTGGTSGTSGSNGTNGSSGTSGSNGTNGSSGTSGSNGTNGSSGTSGSDGTNGSSGSSGSNGTNGSSGSSGTSGINGTSGSNGTNGSSGTAGTSGIGLGISTKAGSVDATGWLYDSDNNQYTKLITFSSPFASTNYTVNSVYSLNDPNEFTVVRTGFSGKTVNGFTAIVGALSGSIAPTFEYTATAFQETGVPGTSGTSGTSGSGTSGTSGVVNYTGLITTGSLGAAQSITGSLNISGSNPVLFATGTLQIKGPIFQHSETPSNAWSTGGTYTTEIQNYPYNGKIEINSWSGSLSVPVNGAYRTIGMFVSESYFDSLNNNLFKEGPSIYTNQNTGSTSKVSMIGFRNNGALSGAFYTGGTISLMRSTEITGSLTVTGSVLINSGNSAQSFYVTGSKSWATINTNQKIISIGTGSASQEEIGITIGNSLIGSNWLNKPAIYTYSNNINMTGAAVIGFQSSGSYTDNRVTILAPLEVSGSLYVSGSAIITGSVQGNVNSLSIASTTASLNLNDGNFFTLQLVSGSSTHLNPSNIKPGQTVSVFVNTTGSARMTFASSVKQISGSAYVPTTTTGIDILTLISKDSSSLYLVNAQNFI